MQITKSGLRKELMLRRKRLDKSTKQKYDEAIHTKLTGFVLDNDPKSVLCYVSTEIEADTVGFIKDMLSVGKAVFVPKCIGKDMKFLRLNDFSELIKGAYGIPEPTGTEEIADLSGSVCVVPALSYNKNGFRLGYGGGYYDRFLKSYRGFSIGICYSDFIGDIPLEIFDVPVDIVITEGEIFRCGGKE